MNDDSKDIFDHIMEIRVLSPFFPLYRKYKEGLLYLFFGGLTFFLAIAVYVILLRCFGVHELISNVVSWICGVTFSFFTTKKWVFRNNNWELGFITKQIAGFYAARLATLLLQEILLYIFITRMSWNDIGVKIVTEMINIILNYLVSKFIIFSRSE